MDIDVNDFFFIFISLLIIGIAVFWFYNSNFHFECPLFNGGYFEIEWMKEEKRFRVFHWKPGKDAKPLPKNPIILRPSKKDKDNKE